MKEEIIIYALKFYNNSKLFYIEMLNLKNGETKFYNNELRKINLKIIELKSELRKQKIQKINKIK